MFHTTVAEACRRRGVHMKKMNLRVKLHMENYLVYGKIESVKSLNYIDPFRRWICGYNRVVIYVRIEIFNLEGSLESETAVY